MMYFGNSKLSVMVLQSTFTNGSKGYTDLGKDFSIVEKEMSKDEFMEVAKKLFGENDTRHLPECYGFVFYRNGAETQPLYEGFDNYLLNDNGGLFKDISLNPQK